MKKFIAVLLCLCMLLSLAACGGPSGNNPSGNNPSGKGKDDAPGYNDNPGPSGYSDFPAPAEFALELGKEYTISGQAKFHLVKIWTTRTITASFHGRTLENTAPGEVFVDAVFEWDNTGNDDFDYGCPSFVAVDASGKEYTGNVGSENEGNNIQRENFSGFLIFGPGESTRVHAYVSVPEGAGELTLSFTAYDQTYKCRYTVGSEFTTAKDLKPGDSIEASFANFTLNSTYYSRLLEPEHGPSSYYSFNIQGPDADKKTFLVAEFTAKNKTSNELDAYKLMGAGVQYADYVSYGAGPYDGDFLVEDVIEIPGFYQYIKANDTKKYYALMEVPLTNTPAAFTITVIVEGKEYNIHCGEYEIIKKPEPIIPLSAESLQIGNYVGFGVYEQDNNFENGPEPIEWKVLDCVDGYYLLLSKFALDIMPFTREENVEVTWEYCDIRWWLNNDFKITIFTEEEQKLLVARLNPSYWGTPVYGASKQPIDYGNDTMDSVFLLSMPEVKKYMPNEEDQSCGATEYVYQKSRNGAYANIDTNYPYVFDRPACCWWLRNHSDNWFGQGCVAPGGGTYAWHMSNNQCLRPAIWVKNPLN